jgi:hypothetical protein
MDAGIIVERMNLIAAEREKKRLRARYQAQCGDCGPLIDWLKQER